MLRSLSVLRGLKPVAILAAGLTLAMACGTPGGSGTSNTGQAKSGGKVTLASWQEPSSMLSAGITDSMTHAIAQEAPVVEGLTSYTNKEDLPKSPKQSDYFQPQLATEIPTTDNGGVKIVGTTMEITYKLRHGVTWHDGKPFNADDVVDTANFWWLKYKDQNPTPVVSTSGWDQMQSATKVDDYTVKVVMKTVYGPYLALFSGVYGVLPSHLLQSTWSDATGKGDMTKTKLSIDLTSANSGAYKGSDTWDQWLVGTGPFVFKEWVSGDHMTLVKNNNYYGSHKAYLDQITIKFEPDTNTQLADLRTGTVDFGVDFRAALLSPLGHVDNTTVQLYPESGAEHIDLNLKSKYLSDLVIRKAILQSIDRQKLVDTLLEGKAPVPADSWLCVGTGDWCADASVPKTKYDPKAAQDALDAAGYKKDKDKCGGMRAYKDGSCISINLVTTSGNALREQQEVQIASDLASVGINVPKPFNNVRSGKLFGSFASGGVLYNHTFDMAQYTNTYGAPAEPDGFYGGYVCDQIPTQANGGVGQNATQTCDPSIDKAFQAGRATANLSERKAAYVNAQKAIAALIPDIPLYQQLGVNAYSKKIGGVKTNEFVWWNNTGDWYLTS